MIGVIWLSHILTFTGGLFLGFLIGIHKEKYK